MTNWWKQAAFYEIYMPSFKDGNRDGIGDFKGITSKLDYLKELGINGIWLTPFYPSPKVDNGYDIADYYGIDSDYGMMEDFELFLKEAHRRDIKVIADLVLNHTSTLHPWFKESRASKDSPKRDWYIWRDEPNNWESFFGGSAWEYDATSGQYYYHAFAKEQVDLNWANSEVKAAMLEVMKYWLDKGVDGFRLDVINFLKVSPQLPDNPFDAEKKEQIHLYDQNQEGIIGIIEEISAFVHQYPDKFLVGEVGSEDLEILKRYSGVGKLDVVFNFNIGSIESFNPERIVKEMLDTNRVYRPEQLPTLFFSSHDMSRSYSRFGGNMDRAKGIAALMLTAKGVPFIYFGDEIGMHDWVTDDIRKMKDVQGLIAYNLTLEAGKSHKEALAAANEKSRDKSRTPMQWDTGAYVGFSEVSPWISIPEEARGVNVAVQETDPDSMLSFYRRLLELRKLHPVITRGDYEYLHCEDDVIQFVRTFENEQIFVGINFAENPRAVEAGKEMKLLLSNKREFIKSSETITLLANEVIILKGDVVIDQFN